MDPKKIASLAKQLAKALKQLNAQQIAVDDIRAQIQAEVGGSPAPFKARKIKTAKTKAPKKGGKRAARGSVAAAINEAIESGKNFKVDDIVASIEKSGAAVSKGSVNAGIGKILKDKKIKRVSRGVYAKA